MKLKKLIAHLAIAIAATAACAATSRAAVMVFDDFNTDEGHFNLAPNFSGSSSNIAATSTADRITSDKFEGAGSEQLVLNATTAGNASRVRFLSGSGSAGNNVAFTTSSGTDGWIGLAVKTDSPGWTVQIWLEGAENNGSIPKNVAADNAWHLYQWNLDDETGGADGWGQVAGIVSGDADFQNGSYTIDSVLFRNTAAPAGATILMDYVAHNPAGMLTPEPATCLLALVSGVGALGFARRKVA